MEAVYSFTWKQFKIIKHLIPKQKEGKGRKRADDFTEINALIYVLKTGCQWKALPDVFGIHYTTAWHRLKRWEQEGVWNHIYNYLYNLDRTAKGRDITPTGSCVDSKSVKAKRGGEDIGYDGGKHVKGKKFHMLTDTTGNAISFIITKANFADVKAVSYLLYMSDTINRKPMIMYGDSSYRGEYLESLVNNYNCCLKTMVRTEIDFKVLPFIWIVERTNAWLDNFRRLVVCYERTTEMQNAFLRVAFIYILLKRWKI